MTVKVENLSQLQHTLRTLPESVAGVAAEEIQETAVKVRDEARRTVRDGDVRPTIKKRSRDKGLDATVTAGHWRAKFEEYGTKRHTIAPKRATVLTGGKAVSTRSGGAVFDDEAFGPVSGPVVHPGQRPHPFLIPAFELHRRDLPYRLRVAIRTELGRL
ncbi:MAG: hypothetical protein ACOC3J_05820, partial [Gemmatimonadota bacterium]